MKFDSTIYLVNALGLKLGMEQKNIENCLRVLNGFIVTPNSIHYDEENKILSLILTLPNSNLEIYDATITSTALSLRAGIRNASELSIRLKCSLCNLTSNYAICLGDGSPYAGIYYFNSVGGQKDGNKQYGHYTYFDAETLSRLRYYAHRNGTYLDYIVDVLPTNINSLGYISDNETDDEIEPKAYIDRAKRINSKLKNMSAESIKEMVEKVHIETTSTNNPITI